jgi:hypothetical protein
VDVVDSAAPVERAEPYARVGPAGPGLTAERHAGGYPGGGPVPPSFPDDSFVVTTAPTAPLAPWAVARETLRGVLAHDYPHHYAIWICDEETDERTCQWCEDAAFVIDAQASPEGSRGVEKPTALRTVLVPSIVIMGLVSLLGIATASAAGTYGELYKLTIKKWVAQI